MLSMVWYDDGGSGRQCKVHIIGSLLTFPPESRPAGGQRRQAKTKGTRDDDDVDVVAFGLFSLLLGFAFDF